MARAKMATMLVIAFLAVAGGFRELPHDTDPIQEHYEPVPVEGEEAVTPTKRMQSLMPRIGRCYAGDSALRPAVRLWRERKQHQALKLLKKVHEEAVNKGDKEESKLAEHLMVNIAQMHDMYDKILKEAKAILAQSPKDVHALFVMALYKICAMSNPDNIDVGIFDPTHDKSPLTSTAEWKALQEASPSFADVLKRVAEDAHNAWDSEFAPSGVVPTDRVLANSYNGTLVIGVFGWGPITGSHEEGWTALPPMAQRIDAGLKLAEHFKEAKVIASGGAVTSGMAEGEFINKTMVEKDPSLKDRIIIDPLARDSFGNAIFIADWIQKHVTGEVTLFIVGSDWQDPRFRAIVGGVFENMGIKAALVPVGAGWQWTDGKTDPATHEPLAKRIKTERTAIYRDLARARGYFEYCDFESGAPPKSAVALLKSLLFLALLLGTTDAAMAQ